MSLVYFCSAFCHLSVNLCFPAFKKKCFSSYTGVCRVYCVPVRCSVHGRQRDVSPGFDFDLVLQNVPGLALVRRPTVFKVMKHICESTAAL